MKLLVTVDLFEIILTGFVILILFVYGIALLYVKVRHKR